MRIRTLLTAGAAAAVATATALAAPSIARAANGPAPAINVVQPASPTSFENASGGVSTGPITGIMPARGTSLKKSGVTSNTQAPNVAAAAAATCPSGDEPDCNLVFNGGPVEHSPRVYIIFWGPKWTSDTATQTFVKNFFTGLGQTSKGDSWSTIVEQYTDKTGRPALGTSLLAATPWVDTTTPPKSVTTNNLSGEALKAVSHWKITDTNDSNVFIVAQSKTCFSPPDPSAPAFTFAGNCGTVQTQGYCAFHSDTPGKNGLYLPWVNLPYQPDAGQDCGQGFINTPGTDDGFSITGGHELVEAITDPVGNAWIDNSDPYGGEIGDKCAWGGQLWGDNDPAGNVTFAAGTFAMQSLWSNAVGAPGTPGCVMNGGLSLSVTTPATQTVTLGKSLSLQVHASINGNTPLTYSASGLPAGLSINKNSGVITGTPNGVTAGPVTSHVTVAYYDGWRTVTFGWQVSSPVGQVKEANGKCLDDSAGKTTAGNKIQIWTCNTGAAQKVTFAANNELQVVGSCVTGTSSVALEPCAGATSQQWTRLSNGEYVLKSNGECLTDLSSSNGTQLIVAACQNAASQHWSLP